MASVAKWLRQRFVVPPFVGSIPIVRPLKIIYLGWLLRDSLYAPKYYTKPVWKIWVEVRFNLMHENNLQIDETLLQEALALSNYKSSNAVVEAALHEYIQRRKQLKVMELFGTIDYDSDYNYKQQRQRA